MFFSYIFILLYLSAGYSNCHFVTLQELHTSNQPANVCDSNKSASLVENFFNLIFSEFHTHRPICVCVQMCEGQATYCYPNGCFKKGEINSSGKKGKTFSPQVSQVQTDKGQPMSFLIDDQSNFMDNFLRNKMVAETSKPASMEKVSFKDSYRDPLKDRYQSLFKYRKSPKVHLRYNLREQVKHMKSDVIKIQKIDVSKTRWPGGENKQFFLELPPQQKLHEPKKYHTGVALDNGPIQYQSKFFKRETQKNKRGKKDLNEYESFADNSTFSLENFIENIIENSFGPLGNGSELDLSVDVDYSIKQNLTTTEPITIGYKRNAMKNGSLIILNETTNVISMDLDDENLEANAYNGGSKDHMNKNVFNEMIASLSKHIDKNNNNSIHMMEHLLGHRVYDTTARPDTKTLDNQELQVDFTTNLNKNVVETTTDKFTETTPAVKEAIKVSVVKKSHQRFVRKSQNSKTS